MRTPLRGAAGPRLLGIVLLALVASGCAYYNTFYLAKRYYKEGQKAEEKSVSESTSPEALAKYESTIRQCTKVIADYPKSKYVDDALYLMGAALYGKGDYTGSIRRLDDLVSRFPKSPYVPDARFVQGLAYLKRKDYDLADSVFHAVDAAYPNFPRKWELYFNEGENKVLQDQIPAALWWYRRAIGVAKERRQRSDALRRAGDALFTAQNMDSAQVVYGECLKAEDRPGKRLDVALSRGEALRELKRYQEALDFLNQWRAPAQAENREGEVYIRIYDLMALLGRPNDAVAGYRKLVENYAHTNVAYEAQFQIGYLYETALSNLDQAGKEYDKLRPEAESEFKSQASRRSASLASLKQYQQALEADTTGARARSAFRVAELYYFELGKADSAIYQYRLVERDFPNSVFAPKSAYARLWIAAYDRNDTLGAMSLADSIAEQYRGTRFAESALYLWKRWSGRSDERTALLDSLLAHPDTSAASKYIEEPEPQAQAGAAAAPLAPADSGYTIPAEELRRLQDQAAKMRPAQQKRRAGHQPPHAGARTPGSGEPDSTALADSLAEADTTGVSPPAPPGGAAAPDSTEAPPGATGPGETSPADTTKTLIIGPSR
ncbi:MAG TPA: tetratricopeptide repeat protein [Candidatus Eisenbacteria bacterium]